MKFYKVMALQVLLYGSETWAIKQKTNRIQGTEMIYVISVKCCTRIDYI
jgi:hypothetical protein